MSGHYPDDELPAAPEHLKGDLPVPLPPQLQMRIDAAKQEWREYADLRRMPMAMWRFQLPPWRGL